MVRHGNVCSLYDKLLHCPLQPMQCLSQQSVFQSDSLRLFWPFHLKAKSRFQQSIIKKGKGSAHSITERWVPELITDLGSQPAGDVSHKSGGRLPLLSTKPAVTLTTLERAAINFGAWWTEARWVWTVCLRLLPDSGLCLVGCSRAHVVEFSY